MPDTKSGRERNGRKKREQLRRRQYERELEMLDEEIDLPEFGEDETDLPPAELREGR
jgi:glutamate formiminotransferase